MVFDRCPASVASGMDDFLEAYVAQIRGEGWPCEGSRSQQAAWYVRAKALADAERARLEDRPREAAETLGAQ